MAKTQLVRADESESELQISIDDLIYKAPDGEADIVSIAMLPDRLKRFRWMRPFFTSLANKGTRAQACRDANITATNVEKHLKEDPDFAYIYRLCEEHGLDKLEAEAMRRATEGVIEQQFYQGKAIWQTDPETGELLKDERGKPIPAGNRKYSDAILMWLLKVKRYEKGGRKVQVTGDGGGPVKVEHGVDPDLINNAVERAVAKRLNNIDQREDFSNILEVDAEDVPNTPGEDPESEGSDSTV